MNRSWADLPVEILNLFLDRLLFADYARFAAVCKPWLSAAVERPHFRALKFPWLLLPCNTTTTTHQTWGVYSPVEGHTHHLDLLVTPGSACFGASHGWLFIDDNFGNSHLLNPLTNQEIHLPPTFTVPGEAPYRINKAILSSAPTAKNIAAGDCIVVISAIYLDISKLSFCRPGDVTWSNFSVADNVGNDFDVDQSLFYQPVGNPKTRFNISVSEIVGYVHDFIIREEHLYCVNGVEEVFVFKLAPQPMLIRIYNPTRRSDGAHWNSSRPYLVDCRGELLMILRYTGDYVEDESRFEVFKFKRQGTSWGRRKRLGNRILFLGLGCSMSIKVGAVDSPFKRNCIYFTDDCFDEEEPHKLDWGVLCLDDETVRPIYPNDFQSHRCPTPDFQSHRCPPLWLSLNT